MTMDFLSEFRKASELLKSDSERYANMYPIGHKKIPDLLRKMINQLETDDQNYERLYSIARGLYFITVDYSPFAESPFGKGILQILAVFIPYLQSELSA